MRSIVTYRPHLNNLLDSFDSLFDTFVSDSTRTATSRPAVDIREEEEGYVLEADLPGLTEKDVNVNVNDNLLTVSADKTGENESNEKNGYIVRERRSRSFKRSFVLPRDVDRDKIEASFSNGVLSLSLPKTAEAKPRQIEVKGN